MSRLHIFLEHKGRVIAELAKVLQRLEYMLLVALLTLIGRAHNVLSGCMGVRFGEVVVHILLHFRELAVVVLYDFGRQIVEHIFFQST